MLACHRRARALGLRAIGLFAGPAGDAASAQPGPFEEEQAAASCAEPIGQRQCLRRRTPANLMLLPCVAVGAKAMAACRDREVGLCIETCRRRFC